MEHSPKPHLSRVCVPFPNLIRAGLVKRVNRFRVQIRIGSELRSAYLANPGRLEELMTPGQVVWVKPASGPHRKTSYDLILTEYANTLVSMNSHLPNRLLQGALTSQMLPWFASYGTVQNEARLGDSRLDFRLADDQGHACWLEAKSVTLVEGGVAQFPDAPTERGRRHLRELIAARKRGDRAAVVFVVQRDDAVIFRPRDETDPEFGATLRAAADAGVEIRALRCTVTTERICLDRPVTVSLDGDTRPAIISAEADVN